VPVIGGGSIPKVGEPDLTNARRKNRLHREFWLLINLAKNVCFRFAIQLVKTSLLVQLVNSTIDFDDICHRHILLVE